MTDIVEMLRKGEDEGVDGWWSVMAEGANEIERLRLELDMQQATILVPSQKDDQRRIERLNSALAEALDEAATLRAENEKLRMALIALYKPVFENPVEVGSTLDLALRAAAAAIRESVDE